MKKFLFFLVFFLLFISCKKEKIVDVNPDFVGGWLFFDGSDNVSDFITFTIESNSNGRFVHNYGDRTDEFTGMVRIKDDLLKIGTKRFRILKFPSQIDYSNGRDTIYVPFSGLYGNTTIATWEMEIKSLGPYYLKGPWLLCH